METDTNTADGDAGQADASTDDDTGTDTDATALKNALNRERQARREAEKRVKALEPLEKAAKDAEDANKSELQKLTDALSDEKVNRTKAETALLRYQVAADKGVPLSLARFLNGASKEEIEEAADVLLKELGTKPSLPGRPTERRLSSGKPSSAEGSDDPMDLIKQARRLRD